MAEEGSSVAAPPATVVAEPGPTHPQKRPHKPSAKARAAAADAAEETAAKEPPKKHAKNKKHAQKESQQEPEEDAAGNEAEEVELAPETPETSKKREQKNQVCLYLHAKEKPENSRKLPYCDTLLIADKLTLITTAKSGASAGIAIRPGDYVTAWAHTPAQRKQRYCVYRIQKGVSAVHWSLLARLGVSKELTRIYAHEVITIEHAEPLDTLDERNEYMDAFDKTNATANQTAAAELQQVRKETKEAKQQKKSTSPKTLPTPGGTVSSGDFAVLRQEMHQKFDLVHKELQAQSKDMTEAITAMKHTTSLLVQQITNAKEIGKQCLELALTKN